MVDTLSVLSAIPTRLNAIVPKNFKLSVVLADDLVHISGDPHQLEQIVINLALNACDAMPTGGKLTILNAMKTLRCDETRQIVRIR